MDRTKPETRWNRRRRYKAGEYKEDCTVGQYSILNPVEFKGDALVQVWVDSRELATVSEWLDRIGCRTRFLSEVIKESIHILCQEVVESGEINLIEDTNEARYILEDKYKVNLNPNGRGEKNVLHNIILSERRKEAGSEQTDRIKELQRKAREIYRQSEGDGKSNIFDELDKIEKGESNGAAESKDESERICGEDEGNKERGTGEA